MLSLSERIVQCVTLAGDGRYTPVQIAELLGESEEWVEQILAAWEYNPKAHMQFSFPFGRCTIQATFLGWLTSR